MSKQVKKQVKNLKKVKFSTCSPSDTFFEEPHSICCYFLATPTTYSAKMARKSKFRHIWLICRKKGSGMSEMCTMGSFKMFPHQITWKTNLWKLSQKSHVEYSHGLLNCRSLDEKWSLRPLWLNNLVLHKGTFKNYVDKFLAYPPATPPPTLIFSTCQKVDIWLPFHLFLST